MVGKHGETQEAQVRSLYVGVASLNAIAVNPSNEELRRMGVNVPDDAEEKSAVYVHDNGDGTSTARTRVSVWCGVKDKGFEGRLVRLDFWVSPEPRMNAAKDKVQVIDRYGRTAWATQAEYEAGAVPQYANGPARLDKGYKVCHAGEEALVSFLREYLCVPQADRWDKAAGRFVPNPGAGVLTVDGWDALCGGDVSEVREMLALEPGNAVKAMLGVRTGEDNRTYQTFYGGAFWPNWMRPDRATGAYNGAQREVDSMGDYDRACEWSAAPVHEWAPAPTQVSPSGGGTLFDGMLEGGPVDGGESGPDDLPFE